MHKLDPENYRDFLENRIEKKLIDDLTSPQKQSLIDSYNDFPLGLDLRTSLDEKIKFLPNIEHPLSEYIHHFLIKHNKGKDYYSKKYLEYYKWLRSTIEEHDERILHVRVNSDRICFVKQYMVSGSPIYHVVPCNFQGTQIIPWTHFDAKEKYIKSLQKLEERLISQRGLIDINGVTIDLNYSQYSALKRKTLLYLGSNVLSELHRSQESPLGL